MILELSLARIITLQPPTPPMRLIALAALLLLAAGTITPALAHTTVQAGPYEIEAGWGVEPPVVGILNQFVFKVIERGENEGTFQGITNAFRDATVTASFGGATKELEISSDPRPGYYYSPVLPTRTGTYMVTIEGQINGVAVSETIPIEDVGPTSVLDFPPAASSEPADVSALKNAISSLQREVSSLKSGGVVSEGGASYDIAVMGLSIAGAAIVLAVVSMIKRK